MTQLDDPSHLIEHVFTLWTYPLQWGDTLSNHDWVPLYINRLLTSRFLARCLAEDRRADIGTAVILWCEAFRQDPAGTLPDDDTQLARLAGYGADVDAWRKARPGVLHGWGAVEIDGDGPIDERRLGHRMIEKIAFDMFKRAKGRAASRVEGALRVRQTRVKKVLIAMGLPRLAENAASVRTLAEYLGKHDLHITETNVREALEVNAVGPRAVK